MRIAYEAEPPTTLRQQAKWLAHTAEPQFRCGISACPRRTPLGQHAFVSRPYALPLTRRNLLSGWIRVTGLNMQHQPEPTIARNHRGDLLSQFHARRHFGRDAPEAAQTKGAGKDAAMEPAATRYDAAERDRACRRLRCRCATAPATSPITASSAYSATSACSASHEGTGRVQQASLSTRRSMRIGAHAEVDSGR